jgi:hypothetical protein
MDHAAPMFQARMNSMSASLTTYGYPIRIAAPVAVTGRGVMRRRRIAPQAGRALEILGHAIEYLADEFVYAGGSFSARDPQVEAVQLLMGLNREIYLDCPEVPTFAERCRELLHLRTA